MIRVLKESKGLVLVNVQNNVPFSLERTPTYEHQFGYFSAPLFTLVQPFAPDEGWQVHANPNGAFVENDDCEYGDVLPGWAKAKRGLGVFDVLPSGKYLILRCEPNFVCREHIYLGNAPIVPTPNMRILLYDKCTMDAVVVGAPKSAPPRLDFPLIGVAVLRQTGVSVPTKWNLPHEHMVLFFSFGNGTNAEISEIAELVLIVPLTGDLGAVRKLV
jgi:hypothetical protein